MYLGRCSVVGGSISGRPCIVPGGVVRCTSEEATGGRTAEKHGGRDQVSDGELRDPVARRGGVGRFSVGASRGLESCQRIRASRARTAPHPARGLAGRVRPGPGIRRRRSRFRTASVGASATARIAHRPWRRRSSRGRISTVTTSPSPLAPRIALGTGSSVPWRLSRQTLVSQLRPSTCA